MLGITILIFEILIVILFAIFIRTDATSTASLTSLDSGLFFTVGTASLTQPSPSSPLPARPSIGPSSPTTSSS